MKKEKALDSVDGLMEQYIKENGELICATVKGCSFHLTARYMKENGLEMSNKEPVN